jgi:arsenate reductase (thioredoxin)
MTRSKVLFLCTGNSARSQMAEGLLRHYVGDRFEVHSAGLEPKGINPYAIRAMDELGIDIRSQTSDSLKKYMGHVHFQYGITVCSHADHHCPHALFSRGQRLHWPFDDPADATGSDEAIMDKFREVRDQIDTRIKQWLEELTAETA